MSNEVANVFGGSVSVAASAEMAAKLNDSAQNDPRGGAGDSEYLNFSGKRGRYSLGPDEYQPDPEELWLLNVMSFEDGWVAWKGGRPQANRMANIYNEVAIPTPDMEEGGPYDTGRGEGWFQAKSITIKALDSGRQGYFKINSKSGVSAIAGLQKEVGQRMSSGEPCWPIIQLDMEEFESQGYKNFKPVFHIYGWIGDAQMQGLADGEDVDDLIAAANGPAQVEAPKKGRSRAKL